MTAPFRVDRPDDAEAIGLLVHLPHAGTVIPAHVRAHIVLDDATLAEEVRALTDWYTDALFGPPAFVAGATVVTNHLSRLVVDPERLPQAREPMAAIGMGAVYTRTRHGHVLRDGAQMPPLIDAYFQPWADAVEAEVARLIARFGRCLILDGHSFPARPFPFEDATRERPDVALGFSAPHAPVDLLNTLAEVVRAHGRTVAANTPFAGAYVPLSRHGRDDRVRSVMVELNRGMYLDDHDMDSEGGYAAVAALVADLIATAVRWVASDRE